MYMSDTLLEVSDLEVIYKSNFETVYAVNGLSFSLKCGEVLGMVGETGAGKTTTSLAIMGLLPDHSGHIKKGRILFDGIDLLQLKKKKMQKVRGKKISMIFQDPMTALDALIPVGNQIYEALKLHNEEGKTQAELHQRVDEMLTLVGIPANRKHEYPHQFSGGMKQRVVIAIALACEPELLIADEPTTALDVTIQAQVLMTMKELKERLNTSMIMITHDLGIVAQTCDSVAVMYAGQIIEHGSLEDIFSPGQHHPYTEGLFNSIPNLDVVSKRLKPIDGLMPDPTRLPLGCKFSPRCPQKTGRCDSQEPPACRRGNHTISCHLFSGIKL
jgi:peptide/nickel transport system ATP-binding protein